jgi:hypothetical protein
MSSVPSEHVKRPLLCRVLNVLVCVLLVSGLMTCVVLEMKKNETSPNLRQERVWPNPVVSNASRLKVCNCEYGGVPCEGANGREFVRDKTPCLLPGSVTGTGAKMENVRTCGWFYCNFDDGCDASSPTWQDDACFV